MDCNGHCVGKSVFDVVHVRFTIEEVRLGTPFPAEKTLDTPYDEDQIYALSLNAEIVAVGKPYDSDIYVDTRVYEIESGGSLKQVVERISPTPQTHLHSVMMVRFSQSVTLETINDSRKDL